MELINLRRKNNECKKTRTCAFDVHLHDLHAPAVLRAGRNRGGGTILLSTVSMTALARRGLKIKILMIQKRIHYLATTRLL